MKLNKFVILILILLLILLVGYIDKKTYEIENGLYSQEIFPENIEYCQNVYRSGQNPLNQVCNLDQVERSLNFNF